MKIKTYAGGGNFSGLDVRFDRNPIENNVFDVKGPTSVQHLTFFFEKKKLFAKMDVTSRVFGVGS